MASADLGGVVPGGVTKGYEGRERAVLQEYQVILQKIVDRSLFQRSKHVSVGTTMPTGCFGFLLWQFLHCALF